MKSLREERSAQPEPQTLETANAAGGHRLHAYQVMPELGMRLVPAARTRDWMGHTTDGFANRCLPMIVANQAGWMVLNGEDFVATWNGGLCPSDVHISRPAGTTASNVQNHFGHGILTWKIPYLFRTPHGFNLLVRGPANYPKDGVYPLDGVVETDRSFATFTMNWKLTAAGKAVRFERQEPICMLVPQRRHELESFLPEVHAIQSAPDLEDGYRAWRQARESFFKAVRAEGPKAHRPGSHRQCLRGQGEVSYRGQAQQTRLSVRSFTDKRDATAPGLSEPVPAR